MSTRGVLYVHSATPAVTPHIEWAVAGVLSTPVRFEWLAQPASPGIFSANDSGYGDGAITHVSNASVNSNNPAQPSETVQMYVSGLGALSTPVTDGNGAVGIDDAVTKPQVYINGEQASVGYWGLTVDAGLYQINFTVPADTPNGEQSVIVFIPNGATGALTQTVTIAVQAPAAQAGT